MHAQRHTFYFSAIYLFHIGHFTKVVGNDVIWSPEFCDVQNRCSVVPLSDIEKERREEWKDPFRSSYFCKFLRLAEYAVLLLLLAFFFSREKKPLVMRLLYILSRFFCTFICLSSLISIIFLLSFYFGSCTTCSKLSKFNWQQNVSTK